MGFHTTKAGPADPDLMIDINTTPLIDVMLVLLVMLIITIPIQLHAVNLNLPTATPPPSARPPVIIDVDVDFDGAIYWNGQLIPDAALLQERLRQAASQADQPELHLRANGIVRYKHVAAVMASAQRLGLTRIGLVAAETSSR